MFMNLIIYATVSDETILSAVAAVVLQAPQIHARLEEQAGAGARGAAT